MDISDNSRELLVKEINFIVGKIKQSSKANEKLYYFSGIHGMVHRILNLEYSSDLIYIHFVVRQTYDAFFGRLNAIEKGGERTIPLVEDHFKNLTAITEELGSKIEKKEGLNDTFKKFAILSYSTTGNGYYLQQKGLLKF